jgi:hypothetical protein
MKCGVRDAGYGNVEKKIISTFLLAREVCYDKSCNKEHYCNQKIT